MIGSSTCVEAPAIRERSNSLPVRPLAQALEGVGNRAEMSLGQINSNKVFDNYDEVRRVLAQNACRHFMPCMLDADVFKVAGDVTDDGKHQVKLAILLFLLSQEPGMATDKEFQQASNILTTALRKSVTQGVAKLSFGLNPSHKQRYSNAEAVTKLISSILERHPDAENNVVVKVYKHCVAPGLQKKFTSKLPPGSTPSAGDITRIQQSGNGREIATASLLAQADHIIDSDSRSQRFSDRINCMLRLLDLDMKVGAASAPGDLAQASPPAKFSTPAENFAHWPAGNGLSLSNGNVTGGDVKIDLHDFGQAGSVKSDTVEALRVFAEHSDSQLKLCLDFARDVLGVRNLGSASGALNTQQNLTSASRVLQADNGGITNEQISAGAPLERAGVVDIDNDVVGAHSQYVQDDAIAVTTGAEDSGGPPGAILSAFVETDSDSDSGVEGDIPAPPPMPRSVFPSDIDDSVRANSTSLMAELETRLAGGLNLRASTNPVEPALDQRRDAVQSDASLASRRSLPSRRRSESSDSNRSSFQAGFQLFESGVAVGRSASATMNTVDTAPLRTFDNLRDSNITSRPVLSGGQTGYSSAVAEEDSKNDFLVAARRGLKPTGIRNGSAQAGTGRASISADAAFDVGHENVFASVDRSSRATTPDIGTSADVMGMDQAQNLERSDSLSELAMLPSMKPFSTERAKVHAQVNADNLFFGSLGSGTHMKGRQWQN